MVPSTQRTERVLASSTPFCSYFICSLFLFVSLCFSFLSIFPQVRFFFLITPYWTFLVRGRVEENEVRIWRSKYEFLLENSVRAPLISLLNISPGKLMVSDKYLKEHAINPPFVLKYTVIIFPNHVYFLCSQSGWIFNLLKKDWIELSSFFLCFEIFRALHYRPSINTLTTSPNWVESVAMNVWLLPQKKVFYALLYWIVSLLRCLFQYYIVVILIFLYPVAEKA